MKAHCSAYDHYFSDTPFSDYLSWRISLNMNKGGRAPISTRRPKNRPQRYSWWRTKEYALTFLLCQHPISNSSRTLTGGCLRIPCWCPCLITKCMPFRSTLMFIYSYSGNFLLLILLLLFFASYGLICIVGMQLIRSALAGHGRRGLDWSLSGAARRRKPGSNGAWRHGIASGSSALKSLR